MASANVPRTQVHSERKSTPIGRRIVAILPHVVMIVILFFLFLPIIWLISTSFKDRLEFSTNSAGLIPRRWSMINYQYMFENLKLLPLYFRNSFILAGGTALLQVIISSLAGYGFARMRFRGRDIIFGLMLISMFLPRAGGLMALYELMTFLKLRNSLLGLILLFAAGVPGAIFIMRQTFLAIPQEIEEAALIDGASWWQVFRQVALPLATSGMVVVATLAFVGVWSDFLVTFTLIDKDAYMPISVGIRKLLIGGSSYETALSPLFRGQFAGEAADAALLLFATIPVVVVYAVLQRWFMRGLMEGALKG